MRLGTRKVLALLLLSVGGCMGKPPSEAEKMRRNMQQSGVDDVQIPLEARRAYAEEHGLRRPDR